jgi:hypothetical protein
MLHSKVVWGVQEMPIDQGFMGAPLRMQKLKTFDMADKPITTGATTNGWQILSVDGKRACCSCSCGAVRVLAISSLLDGTAAPSCGCAPLSSRQIAQQRGETEQQRRQRELRNWRPQA